MNLLGNGYEFKPYNSHSGRPRWAKDIKKATIFYFPIGNRFYHLLIRGVKDKWLEDLFENIVHESIITDSYIVDNETYCYNNSK